MKPTTRDEIAGEVRQLLTDLWTADEKTGGRPRLSRERTALAREWLSRIVSETEPFFAHIDLLQALYGAKFRMPPPRLLRVEGEPLPRADYAAGFRHNRLLPERQARAIVERGPGTLTDGALARLLLNPFALWDLGDRIHTLWPDYWWPRIDEAGRRYMEEYGLDVPIPGCASDTSKQRRREKGRSTE